MSDDVEGTKQEYHLKCEIRIKEIPVNDIDKQFTRKIAILIPEATDQAVAFYSAWLPDKDEDYFEIGMMIRNFGLCRGAILRRNKNYPGHHIHVMSVGLKDEFIKHGLNGSTILLTVLSEDAEENLDNTQETDGSYDIIDN